MGGWIKHYLEHYARENFSTKEVLDVIEGLPVSNHSIISIASTGEKAGFPGNAQYQDNYHV